MRLARFIGENGSMGFKYGKDYWVKITYDINTGWYWVNTVFSNLSCPYGSPAAIRANWELG